MPNTEQNIAQTTDLNEMPEQEKCCCCEEMRHTARGEEERKALMNRLNRIEGQIRGIKKMLENDAYCIDILTQVAAANAAMNSVSKLLLSQHIKNCVVKDVQEGSSEKLDELVKTLEKLMK